MYTEGLQRTCISKSPRTAREKSHCSQTKPHTHNLVVARWTSDGRSRELLVQEILASLSHVQAKSFHVLSSSYDCHCLYTDSRLICISPQHTGFVLQNWSSRKRPARTCIQWQISTQHNDHILHCSNLQMRTCITLNHKQHYFVISLHNTHVTCHHSSTTEGPMQMLYQFYHGLASSTYECEECVIFRLAV